MGSLLPGWDERAPGVAPKNFQEFDENEENEEHGYFAAYAKLKKLQKESGEAASPMAIRRAGSLARRSIGTSAEAASPMAIRRAGSLARRSTGTSSSFTRDWAPMSPQNMRALARSETVAAGRAPSHAGSSPAHLQRMFSMPQTRGERFDVLAGLGPTSPSGASSSTPRSPGLDAYKTQHVDKEKHDYQWWRHFDSAAMNERPDEPVFKEKGYKPQYGVTGQAMHYHQEPAGAQATGHPIIPAH